MVSAPTGSEALDDLLVAVLAGLRGVTATPRSSTCVDLQEVIEEALTAARRDGAAVGRVLDALRAAHAHLGAHQIQDAYVSLLCAREGVDGR